MRAHNDQASLFISVVIQILPRVRTVGGGDPQSPLIKAPQFGCFCLWDNNIYNPKGLVKGGQQDYFKTFSSLEPWDN